MRGRHGDALEAEQRLDPAGGPEALRGAVDAGERAEGEVFRASLLAMS